MISTGLLRSLEAVEAAYASGEIECGDENATADRTPLVEKVMGIIRGRITAMSLAPGARLPSIRRLAEAMNVSKSTVFEAYDRLGGGRHNPVAPRCRFSMFRSALASHFRWPPTHRTRNARSILSGSCDSHLRQTTPHLNRVADGYPTRGFHRKRSAGRCARLLATRGAILPPMANRSVSAPCASTLLTDSVNKASTFRAEKYCWPIPARRPST